MYSEHMLLAAEMPSCGVARRGVAAARMNTTALRLHQPSVMDQLAARASQLDHFATNTDRATALSRETARCTVFQQSDDIFISLFVNNLVENDESILIIIGTQNPEKNSHKQL